MAALTVNDYIAKQVKREQLLSIVRTAALVRTYGDDIAELFAPTARQQALEEVVPADELEASEAFDRPASRIVHAQDSIDDTIEKL